MTRFLITNLFAAVFMIAAPVFAGGPYHYNYNKCYPYGYNYSYNYQKPVVDTTQPDWRGKLIEKIAEKYRVKANSDDYKAGLRALTGQDQEDDTSLIAEQGSTVYLEHSRGTLLGQPLIQYSQYNLPVLQNQYARTVEKAQELGQDAANGHLELLKAANTSNERVARILALAELSKTLDVPENTKSLELKGARGGAKPRGKTQPAGLSAIDVIAQRCVSCHSAQNPQGNLDMSKWFSFSEERKEEIRARTLPNVPDEQRMPKVKDGDHYVPGDPLTLEELKALGS